MPPSASDARAPSVLRYGSTLPIERIDALAGSWNEISSMIYSRPVVVDPFGEIRPDLVSSWTVSDDGTIYRLTVRDDAAWHDGTPVSPADVALTLRMVADPTYADRIKPALPDVESVEIDGTDVVLTFGRRVAGVLPLLARACVVPAHLVTADEAADGALDRLTVGTGPYRLVERGAASGVLEAHGAYHGGTPGIDRVEIELYAHDTARAEALVAGAIDFAQVKPQDIALLRSADDVVVHQIATRVWRALSFILDRPLVSDADVRRGLAAVIDRAAVVDAALGGFGQPQPWAVPPSSWAAPDREPPSGVAVATEHLERAGWRRDGVGRWCSDGVPVELRFCYLETEAFRIAASRELARQFEAFGVSVVLEPITWQQYHEMDRTGLAGGPFDGIVVGWSGGPEPFDNLHSRYGTTGAYNRYGYSDATLDELLERAEATADRSVAAALYANALEIADRAAIMVPLVNPTYLFAARRGLTGFEQFELDSFYELTQYLHHFTWNNAD